MVCKYIKKVYDHDRCEICWYMNADVRRKFKSHANCIASNVRESYEKKHNGDNKQEDEEG